MKAGSFAVGAVVLLSSWLALAGQQPQAAHDAPQRTASTDAYDLVFLGETHPVLICLHVRIDGKPLRQAWDDFIDHLFRYLDRDGNGVLSQEELQRAPRPPLLLQLLRGTPPEMRAGTGRPRQELQVSLVGGKVTRAGLAGYYRLSGAEPFVALFQDKTSQAEALTDALFKNLDLNGDGKLSKEELLAAASSLRVLDLNDDELISIQELLPASDGMEGRPPAQREMLKPLSNSTPFVQLSAEDSPTRLAYILLGRYDKDQNQKLSRAEMSLDPRIFDRLDLNHDGELDAEELARFLDCQPIDVELIAQFSASGNAASLDIYDPLLHSRELSPPVPKGQNKSLILKSGEARIDLEVTGAPPGAFPSVRQFLLGQFEAADVDKRGSLGRKQVQENLFLAALFPATEEDGNRPLSKQEFAALVDPLGKAVASSVVLTITDQGRGMFELLNSYHDGRLRQRELKLAWARLASWDRDGDGQIARNEIPHEFHLRLSQGPTADSVPLADGAVIPLPSGERITRANTRRGPLWFQKMDRNGDGEISLREWLGSKEDFRRIDTNGDGIISLEEAERADAQFRKQGNPQNRRN
jgi:Ca2+-binding EF-hand superfamily protein